MSYEYVNATGAIIPDTATTKEEVTDEYKALFGADLVVDDSSPEGLLINAETEQRDGLARNNAEIANQINPNFAEGIFLDAIWALTDGERNKGTPSFFTTPVNLTGQAGTLIPQGSIAKSSVSQVEFVLLADVILNGSGNGSGFFQSVENGAFQVGIGELDTIVTVVLGWETVSNPVEATPGQVAESDQAARLRRKQTLALQGISLSEAVFSNVRAVQGVTSLSFRENKTSAPVVIDGINLVANSIYVCVNGGTDSAIALALLKSKTGGCNWNGSENVNVNDPVSGQAYVVQFDRPTTRDMEIIVTASAGSSVVDVEEAVKDSVIRYANGEIQGEEGFVIGKDASPFEIAGAVNIDNPEIFVHKVQLDLVGGTPVPVSFPIGLDEIAIIDRINISVVIP